MDIARLPLVYSDVARRTSSSICATLRGRAGKALDQFSWRVGFRPVGLVAMADVCLAYVFDNAGPLAAAILGARLGRVEFAGYHLPYDQLDWPADLVRGFDGLA